MGTSRARFQKKIEQRLRCWGTRRTTLAARLETAGDAAKASLFTELAKLRALEAEGQRCLSAVETAGVATWARLEVDLVASWERVNRAAEAVWTRVS